MNSIVAKVETITPEIAKEYLKFNTINRPLNKNHVSFLAKQMKAGDWKMNGETICFEDTALVDGQHRLHAVIESGVPIDFLVVRGCEKNSFITYDSGRNRSDSDVFHLSDIPNYNSVSSIVKKYFSFHYGWISISNEKGRGLTGLSGNDKKKSKFELLDEYKNNASLYQEAYKLAYSCNSKLNILSTSEIGGLYAYLVKDKKHPNDFVESFFRMMFFDINVSNNTIKLFREKSIQDKLSSKRMSNIYKSTLLIKTWNSYVLGKELKTLSWNEAREGRLNFI